MNENWYDRHVLPYVIDMLCGLRPIREQREKVVPLAYGRVLEVGIGTGLTHQSEIKSTNWELNCMLMTRIVHEERRTKT